MRIQHLTKAAFVSMIALAGSGAALAQSSIQCSIGADGQLQAALVWRNTLGVERADSLCRTAAQATVAQSQRRAGDIGGYQPLAQQVVAVNPVQVVVPQNRQYATVPQATAQYGAPQYAGAPVQQPTLRSPPVVMDDSEYVPLHSAGVVQSASAEFVPMYQR